MNDNIKLAELVGFRVEHQVHQWLFRYFLRFPDGSFPRLGNQSEGAAWSQVPNFTAPHDGLAHLSRWVWPVLKEKGLMREFESLTGLYDLKYLEDILDLPSQVEAAIEVLEGVEE